MYLWWLAALAAMAVYVGYFDCRYRRVSNQSVLLMGILVVCLRISMNQPPQGLQAFGVLFLGGVLFKLNVLAAGDSKLFSILSLAIDPSLMMLTLTTICALGGGLAIGLWGIAKVTGDPNWTQRGVPYAVPICLASLLAIAASL